MSFVLSPTASTSSGEQPTAAQNDRTPAHFETPGAIAVMPQPGQIGSGAQSKPKPAASRATATGTRSPSGRPSTRERVDRLGQRSSAPRSAVRVTPSSEARCPGCDDGAGGSTTSTSGSST